MITVKDLKDYLKDLPDDMPVYWGIDELPCWETKKDAQLKDLPFRVEEVSSIGKYLYLIDYNEARDIIVQTHSAKDWRDKMRWIMGL